MQIIYNTYNTQFYTKTNNYRKNSQISCKAKPTKEELEILLNKGYSPKKISKLLGETWGVVSNWIKEYGLNTISSKNLKDNYSEIVDKIEPLLLQGYSTKDIAEMYGTNRRNIYEIAILLLGKEGFASAKTEGKHNKFTQCANLAKKQIEIKQYNHNIYGAFAETNLKMPEKDVKNVIQNVKNEINAKKNEAKELSKPKNVREAKQVKSQTVLDEALELIKQGFSIVKAAHMVNIRPEYVKGLIDKNVLNNAKLEAEKNKRNSIIIGFKSGYSLNKIQKITSCSQNQILKLLGKEFREMKRIGLDARTKLTFVYLKRGATEEQIADEFGISKSEVRNIIKNNKSDFEGLL